MMGVWTPRAHPVSSAYINCSRDLNKSLLGGGFTSNTLVSGSVLTTVAASLMRKTFHPVTGTKSGNMCVRGF